MRSLCAVLAFMIVLGIAGCAQSERSQINKARLVANENRKLTAEIEQKDKRITELETELAKLKADTQKQLEELNQNTAAVFESMAAMQQELQAENERLKKQLTPEKTN